ncbi:MAG: DUF2586 family protein [Thermonemataceae bacterium]|nr:DUF2586 family protein [Thermonemataceae bacterium]
MLPHIEIENITTQLGQAPAEDGVAMLLIRLSYPYEDNAVGSDPFVLYSLQEAEENWLITKESDTAYGCVFHKHVADFFRACPNGELHIFPIPQAVTNHIQLFGTTTYTQPIDNYLSSQNGRIKLVGVSIAHSSESSAEVQVTGITEELYNAIPNINSWANRQFVNNLSPVFVLVEGRRFLEGYAATSMNSAKNLREIVCPYVSVVVTREQSSYEAIDNNYADIGLALGTLANTPVGWNMGRVASGAISTLKNVRLSGGANLYEEISTTWLNQMAEKGYIFLTRHIGANGWYWSDDPTCTEATASNAYISLVRVTNKAASIVVKTYTQRLKSSFKVNKTTGRLEVQVINMLQNELQEAIEKEMLRNPDPNVPQALSGVNVRIDASQNVLATNMIVVNLEIVPLMVARVIRTRIQMVNPAN